MLESYILEDLRIDPGRLKDIDFDRLSAIAEAYDSRRIDSLVRCVDHFRSRSYA